jgi:hypothetical protein
MLPQFFATQTYRYQNTLLGIRCVRAYYITWAVNACPANTGIGSIESSADILVYRNFFSYKRKNKFNPLLSQLQAIVGCESGGGLRFLSIRPGSHCTGNLRSTQYIRGKKQDTQIGLDIIFSRIDIRVSDKSMPQEAALAQTTLECGEKQGYATFHGGPWRNPSTNDSKYVLTFSGKVTATSNLGR